MKNYFVAISQGNHQGERQWWIKAKNSYNAYKNCRRNYEEWHGCCDIHHCVIEITKEQAEMRYIPL